MVDRYRFVVVMWMGICLSGIVWAQDNERIQPYADNPAYWQHEGEPVLLLGGSKEDNLFQIPDLEEHLDVLASVGGNYVRSTMSARDSGNVWPFARDTASGLYDLNRFNPEYWSRFDRLLELTAEREIIVQLEVWATFDFYDGRDMRRPFWQQNPFNPKNNINYTGERSDLPDTVASHPTQTENPFFFSIPNELDNTVLLPYQQALVDELLRHTLPHGHVLYNMDNETSVTPEWGWYWAAYIRERATEAGVTVETTEMWDPWDLADEMHSHTFDRPDLYSYVDISQNNHQTGQAHWDNAQRQRERIRAAGQVRPLNNIKIYGADGGRFGNTRDGGERFWRNIFGGLASARFHRPESGIGLSETAQAHLRSARLLLDGIDVFRAEPDHGLLTDREENEAYVMAISGEAYAVFFPDGGSVHLDVSATPGTLSVRWLDIQDSTWQTGYTVQAGGEALPLEVPGEGFWAVLVVPEDG